MTDDNWAFSLCLFTIYIYSLVKCLFKSLAHFKIGFLFFLIPEFWVVFLYSGYQTFIRCRVCKDFLPVSRFKSVFSRVEVLKFQYSFIYQFVLLWSCFWSNLRILCLIHGAVEWMFVFSPQSYVESCEWDQRPYKKRHQSACFLSLYSAVWTVWRNIRGQLTASPKEGLIRTWTHWYTDLGLPSPQNYDK